MFAFFSRTLFVHLLFFALLGAGWWLGELHARRIGVLVTCWLAAVVLLPLLPSGILWLTGAIAMLDVVLILMVFKRDLHIR
jgi:hypothetical protein